MPKASSAWYPMGRQGQPRRRPASALGRNQAVADGVAHEAGNVVDVELLHEGGAVRLDRLDAGREQGGDLLGRSSLGDELEDLALARRQVLARAPVALGM